MASRFSRAQWVQIVAQAIVAAAGLAALAWAWRADLPWCERHLLAQYLAYDEGEKNVARNWRIGGALVGVVLLVIGLPLAGKWAKGRSPRDALAAALRIA